MTSLNQIGKVVFIILMIVGIIASLKIVSDPDCYISKLAKEECEEMGCFCDQDRPGNTDFEWRVNINDTNRNTGT